nr:uncharacterized protein LOC118041193 isoform X3 [Populus alba]
MSQSDISYSCGSCGYPLNLTSSNRITSNIGSGYQKSIKKGYGYGDSPTLCGFDSPNSSSSAYKKFTIKIRVSTAFRRVLTKSSWKNLLVVFLPPSCTCPMITCLLFFSCLAVVLIVNHLV